MAGAGACGAAPDEALRTIRPGGAGLGAARRLLRSRAWENVNGNLAAALYPYSVMGLDSAGMHSFASRAEIFGAIVSPGEGVLSSGDAFLGTANLSVIISAPSGCTFCLDGDVDFALELSGVER